MKLGVCTSPDQLAAVYACGYDYIEVNFGWLTNLSDEDYAANTALVEQSPIKVEAFNCFFTGAFPLYAADGDQSEILPQVEAYCEKGFSRAAAWGGKVAVIGSGGARRIPDGMTREQIDPQFAKVLAVCGQVAEKYGMQVVVEPLSFHECNYIHLVPEGVELARMSGQSAVGGLVDFYHYGNNGEKLETLAESAELLYHSHYGRPGDRIAPQPGDEAYLADVAVALKQCPHVERMSLECGLEPDFETGLKIARPLLEGIKQI